MSQPRIYIHIGTHKTGTSAIQDFLEINKKGFKKKGLLFPQKSRRDYYRHIEDGYFVTSSNHKYYRKLSYLCRKKRKNVLLSSETFEYLENISDIKPLLSECEVKIICYVRRQDNMIQSMYNQVVKGTGYYQDISEYKPENLDIYSFLNKWASVFGRSNIIVRAYEKQQFLNGSLIDDFLSIFGIDVNGEFLKLKNNPNPRLSPMILEYMRILNSLLDNGATASRIKEGALDFSAKKYKDATTSIFFNHSLLSNQQRREIVDSYENSNLLVAKEYLGRQDGRLFSEELPQPDGQTQVEDALTDEAVLQITRFLCRDKKNKRSLLTAVNCDTSSKDAFTKQAKVKILNALNQIG